MKSIGATMSEAPVIGIPPRNASSWLVIAFIASAMQALGPTTRITIDPAATSAVTLSDGQPVKLATLATISVKAVCWKSFTDCAKSTYMTAMPGGTSAIVGTCVEIFAAAVADTKSAAVAALVAAAVAVVAAVVAAAVAAK